MRIQISHLCILQDRKGGIIYMNTTLMYSPLETVFQETLKREGRTVTAYTSGKQFQAFMRRNDDGNNFEDRITLFYPITAPVAQGNLISHSNKIYILVNRETEENYCYYKSSALACNGVITLNDGTIAGIPCYASSMKDGLVEQSDAISMIHGNMEFITECNPLSEKIKIDNTFNEYGRTWKIDNTYYKDGILHLITEVSTNEEPYKKTQAFIDSLNLNNKVGDYQITINGRNDLTVGYNRTYTAYLYDSDGTEIESAWNFEVNCEYPNLIETIVNGNKIKIDTKNDINLIGENLMITARETKTGAVGIKSIRLTEAF